jgi:hypothetical protein
LLIMEEGTVKILLLHDGNSKEVAKNLLKQIKKMKIGADSLLVDDTWEQTGSALDEIFTTASHLVLIFSGVTDSVPLGSSLFTFAAGFAAGFGKAAGSGYPLVYYGAAGSLARGLIKDPILVKDDDEFLDWLGRESEEWSRTYITKQARQSLLDQGIPVTADSLGRCIMEKNIAALALFLQAGFSPDTLDNTGVPLLCLAARAGDREIVAALLKAGAGINLKAHDRGGSALIDAALGKHSDIMGDLLAAGAKVDIKSKDGQSALIIAVGLNDEATAEMLLKAGANADEPDSLGASARKYAALFNRSGMVQLFKTHAPALALTEPPATAEQPSPEPPAAIE